MSRPSDPGMDAETDLGWTAETFGATAALLQRFLERLRRLPPGVWTDAINAASELGAADSAVQRAARDRLWRIVGAHHPRAMARTRAALQRLLAGAERGHGSRSEAAAKVQAALTAALALAVSRELSAADFSLLYAPFEGLIPSRELAEGDGKH